MKTIGFVGTAKNTGKTTTAQAVLKQAYANGLNIALTSIGFDSETQIDGINPAKPRFRLEIGDKVATAQQCVTSGSAKLEILETTDIDTPFGKIVIARVTDAGTVLIAGVNREKDLRYLISKFDSLNTDLLLVDGALTRIVPMIACDGLVLSTGAAFEQDIYKLAEHAQTLVNLFTAPIITDEILSEQNICLKYQDLSSLNLKTGSLLSKSTLEEILAGLNKPLASLEIPGACHPMLIKALLASCTETNQPIDLIFGNPLRLIASGNLGLWHEIMQHPACSIHYRNNLPINILTVNPFYLKLKPSTNHYQASYVDKHFLLRTVRTVLPDFPVYDLYQAPQPDLIRLLGFSSVSQ